MRQVPYILACLSTLAFAACSSSSDSGNSTPAITTGTLYGHMYLADTAGKIIPSSAGILVEIPGTSKSTTTDSAGRWSLDLPIGYYTLKFTKQGYTHFAQSEIAFLGTGSLEVYPSYIPLWPITNDTVTIFPPYAINYSAGGKYWTLQMMPTMLNGKYDDYLFPCYFVAKSPQIDYHDSGSYVFYTTQESLGSFNITINGPSFHSGDTVYLEAYNAYGGWVNFQYYDTDGRTVRKDFYGFGKPSNVLKVVLP